jgi:hypothetical protein
MNEITMNNNRICLMMGVDLVEIKVKKDTGLITGFVSVNILIIRQFCAFLAYNSNVCVGDNPDCKRDPDCVNHNLFDLPCLGW